MPKYKIVETFKVRFEIEAASELAAQKLYSKQFDKNIKLSHKAWKPLEKEIETGKFLVYVESENNMPKEISETVAEDDTAANL